jgi:HD-GYP domain-containing protein (c-di-GMP phosphodiesterase class II)
LLLAEELKLSPNEKYQIQIGTPLHDIGKIGIDDAILRKPGKLTTGEFEAHEDAHRQGGRPARQHDPPGPMIPIVRHHHERWDGSGYPDHLANDAIPLIARIVSVADAFDAMTSEPPLSPRHARRPRLPGADRQGGRPLRPQLRLRLHAPAAGADEGKLLRHCRFRIADFRL